MNCEKMVLRLNIKKTGSGTSYVPSLSMKDLEALNEKHGHCHFPRRWRLTLDKSALILE